MHSTHTHSRWLTHVHSRVKSRNTFWRVSQIFLAHMRKEFMPLFDCSDKQKIVESRPADICKCHKGDKPKMKQVRKAKVECMRLKRYRVL